MHPDRVTAGTPAPSPRKALRVAPRNRPRLEAMEGRMLLTAARVSVTAADVPQLIADIAQANNRGGDSTINLVPNATYTLKNTWSTTQDGLPAVNIPGGGTLTINGNGATVTRDQNGYGLRLLEVDGGTLVLNDLTLSGGKIACNDPRYGGGGLGVFGGAAVLKGVTVAGNEVDGQGSIIPTGGGIAVYDASLTLDNCVVSDNTVSGTRGGGWAQGGGLYQSGGSVSVGSLLGTDKIVR